MSPDFGIVPSLGVVLTQWAVTGLNGTGTDTRSGPFHGWTHAPQAFTWIVISTSIGASKVISC